MVAKKQTQKMHKKHKKEVTLDDLARMMQDQFSTTQDQNLKTNMLFSEQFRLIRDDITDIKRVLGPLVRTVGMQEREMSEMRIRVDRLERKAGISR